MRFFGLVVSVAISALTPVLGAPASHNGDFTHQLATRNASTVADTSHKWCWLESSETFIGHTSAASPLVTDCQQIATNIAKDGSWMVGWPATHQIAQYGTCGIGVRVLTQLTVMKLGNLDVIGFINDSIDKFQWNGLVGTEATMHCPDLIDTGNEATARGIFTIYHTS